MSNGFTTSKLIKLGFHLQPTGEWSKDRVQADDTRPQDAKHKRHEQPKRSGKVKEEKDGALSLRHRLIIHSYRTKLIDPSNASMKTIEDCLSLPQGRKSYGIGVFPDDSAKYCDQPLFLQTKVAKGEEKTEIEVLQYYV